MHTDILKHLYTSQDIKEGSQVKSLIYSGHISKIIKLLLQLGFLLFTCEFVLASFACSGVWLWVSVNQVETALIVTDAIQMK